MRHFVVLAVVTCVLGCGQLIGRRQRPYHLYGEPKAGADAYTHYILGRRASVQGQHDVAIAEFRKAAKLAPDEVDPRVAIVEELLASGRGKKARSAARKLLREFPGRGSVWLVWGRIQIHSDHLRAAETALARAIFFDPDQEQAYLLAARVQQRLWRPRAARDTYLRLLQQKPQSFAGHFFLGKLLLAQKQVSQAERAIRQALRIDPDHNQTRVLLARVLREQGDIDQAIRVLRKAFRRSGESFALGRTLVYLHVDGGDMKQAIELLQHLAAPERTARARLEVGDLYLSLKLHAEALALARKVAAAADSVHAARLLEARTHSDLGKFAEAAKVALSITARSGEYIAARALAAHAIAQSGDTAHGLRLLDATGKYPGVDGTPLSLARAEIHLLQNKVSAARATLDNALARRHHQPDLVLARARLEAQHGDPDRAVMMVQALLVQRPEHVAALRFVGNSWVRRGVRLPEAERALETAADLAPNDGRTQAALGWLRFRQGKFERALVVLLRANRLTPGRAEVLVRVGEVHLALGNWVAAHDVFRRALPLTARANLRRRLDEGLRRAGLDAGKKSDGQTHRPRIPSR